MPLPTTAATTATTTTAIQGATTIGHKLDSLIVSVESIPATYTVFGIIVLVFAYIGLKTLNGDTNSNGILMSSNVKGGASSSVCTTSKTTSKSKHNLLKSNNNNNNNEPQPKWHILKMLNVIVVILFISSVFYSAYDVSGVLQDSHSLTRFLGIWSLSLCYFFGFFGISFLEIDDLYVDDGVGNVGGNVSVGAEHAQQMQQQQQQQQHHVMTKNSSVSTNNNKSLSSVKEEVDDSHSTDAQTAAAQRILQKNKDLSLLKDGVVSSKVFLHEPAFSTPVCSDPSSFSSRNTSKNAFTITTTINNNNNNKNKNNNNNIVDYTNEDIANLVLENQIKDHTLEKITDPYRAVLIRRIIFNQKLSSLSPTIDDDTNDENKHKNNLKNTNPLMNLPFEHSLDYNRVHGANCETVVGYIPLPVGMVGPITLNNQTIYFPMATTEGCLVASTNRGCKAITSSSKGAQAFILKDGISRAPVLRCPDSKMAATIKLWCDVPTNFSLLKKAFESTTNFGKLLEIKCTVAGRNVYLRLQCFSGDAMGMNMVSKGTLAVIDLLLNHKFVNVGVELLALSGNMCTDKKAAAINWIEGRGKSVVVDAIIPKDIVTTILKTNVKRMVEVNTNKNLIGSAMAGVIGGYNAHAANIVTAIFLATGQDPAQNVESSNCMTILEENDNGDLWISCTMPSIEVGTVGGGTGLPAQSACLQAIGCQGGGKNTPGENAQQLAKVVAAGTMAGELSLLAALSANTLVQAHMAHNRKKV